LEHVISRGSAVATSQDMNLKADTIDMRVANDLLQQAGGAGAVGAGGLAHGGDGVG